MQHDSELPGSIHPLLAGRFSPYRFDPAATVDDHSLGLLMEAA
ncbi:nitroreductase family protein, partial [Streptomyces sp. NPDC002559]